MRPATNKAEGLNLNTRSTQEIPACGSDSFKQFSKKIMFSLY